MQQKSIESLTEMNQKTNNRDGFTIVEILIVIVVIGILATITVVTYSGIQERAFGAALLSEVKGLSTQLEIENTENGAYPATKADANDGQGLKASSGTALQYTYTSSGNSYCLTGTNKNLSYFVSSTNPTPQTGSCPVYVNGGVVTTLAGSGTAGFVNGTGGAARFNRATAVAVDSDGMVYVADSNNNSIRKITPAGVVTTLAGSATAGFVNGTGGAARFNYPSGVAIDSAGTVYVADSGNSLIRKITPAGVVTTLAGSGTPGFANGAGGAAQFSYPEGVAVDSAGMVYVADSANNSIRKITPAGVVTTLAGSGTAGFINGTAGAAQFSYPSGVATDLAGTVYVTDFSSSVIRKITPTGVVTTLAGSGVPGFANGTGGAAQFSYPGGVAVDSAGTVYVADIGNSLIRKITPAGVVTTLAGSGTPGFANGAGGAAQFSYPSGVATDLAGIIYVADRGNERIREIR